MYILVYTIVDTLVFIEKVGNGDEAHNHAIFYIFPLEVYLVIKDLSFSEGDLY